MVLQHCARLSVFIVLAGFLVVLPEALMGARQPARAAQSVCASPVTLTNGDFEAPVIPAGTMELKKEGTEMPGWLTTAQDNLFELWREVRQGFTSGSGNQFVELNANYVSQLYQDLPTPQSVTLRWELKHRGRLGTDVMAVKIGPPPVGNNPFVPNQSTTVTDGATAWGTWSGVYTVPPGQTTTRFAFDSISTAQNKPTHGNFLDGISFGTASCLESTTTVNGTANVGDVLTYTVSTQNKGGNPAKNVVMTDDLPANVTFVPGSIRSITGATSTAVTDAADTDTGEYDAATRTVRVRSGPTGSTLPVGESRSFSYQVRVGAGAASSTLVNDAAVTYRDDLSGSTLTSTSNSASTVVAAAANLTITAVVAAPGVIAGRTATTNLTIVNNGPDTANAVQANAVIPAGIINITATSSSGACTVNASVATCPIGALAAGATATMNVSGLVIPQATPGAQATLTASVASSTYEISQADNATSVSDTVVTLTNLDVGMTYSPAQPVVGTTVTYRATVRNNGPSTALGVTLTDPITTGSTYLSANPAGAGTCNYVGSILRTLTCSWPSLSPQTSTYVDILVRLDSSESESVHNVVSVTSTTPESDVTDNNASVKAPSVLQADLGVRLTLAKSTAQPGEEVPFTLVVTNKGPSKATNVSFNTVVPPGFTIVRAASPFCTATACTIQELAAGAVIPIQGKAVVGPTAAAGVQQASTTIISPTTDPAPGDETSVVSFTIELEADLRVSQVLSNATTPSNPLVAGEQVRGVVTVVNDGPTRAEGVVLRQGVPAGRPIPVATPSAGTCDFQGTRALDGTTPDGGAYVCNLASLAAATTWEIIFGGVLIAPGYTSTFYSRTATVSTSSPDPVGANNTVLTTRDVEHRSDLRVTKVATPGPPLVQTGAVEFVITVRNLGPSDADGVQLREDPQTGLALLAGTPSAGSYDAVPLTWSLPILTVAEGDQTLTVRGVAQGSGTLVDTTRVVAAGSTDPNPADNVAAASVNADPAAPGLSVSVLTTLNPASSIGAAAHTVIGYVYRITNTGNLALDQLSATGTRGVAGVCGNTTLAPGATTDCAAGTYTVTSGDVTSGHPVGNTVTVLAASAVDTGPVQYANVTASVPVVVARSSLVAVVTPRVDPSAHQYAAGIGDDIEYDYRVTNNGNVDMVDIDLTDTKTGPVDCPVQHLDIGDSMTCHTQPGQGYEVLRSDLDAGQPIADAVTITAKQDGSLVDETYGPFHAEVTVATPAPALTVAVTSPMTSPVAAGGPITYRYVLRNTGNVTINQLTVADSKVTGNDCPASIAAGATVPCESTAAQPYLVTQNDVDAGHPVHNDAIVTGRGAAPGSATATAEGSTSVAVVSAHAGLSITATIAVNPPAHATGVTVGDRIEIDYEVRNIGNVTMRDVAVSDTLGGTALCPGTTVAVGGAMTCDAAPYTVTQDDVDLGTIISAGRVRGRSPAQAAAVQYGSAPVSVTVATGSPGLVLTAEATVSPAEHSNVVDEGDEIDYEYVVTNAGTLTMRQVEVTDSRFGPADCPATTLAPGDSLVCGSARTYTVTAEDVRAGGEIINQVTVSGSPAGGPVVTYQPVRVSVGVLAAEPALRATITPEVTPATRRNAVEPGDTISFHYQVANVGNRAMTGIAATAERSGPMRCPETALAVRESMTCTAGRYTVTQRDVDAGVPITERVSVSGKAPGAVGQGEFGPFEVTVGVAAARPELTLEMSAGVSVAALSPALQAGDLVRYSYMVTNSGNVTIRELVVDDPKAGPVTCFVTLLTAGADTGCLADRLYRVTQSDVDAAKPLVARAYARGVWSGSARAVSSGQARTSVPVTAPRPKLSAGQKAEWTDTDGDGKLGTRDEVVSRVVVTNTGNVTLVNVRVTGLPATVTCPASRLAPGKSMTCVSQPYHLSAADVARGRLTYEAKASGHPTAADAPGAEVRAPSTVVVPARPGKPGEGPGTVPVTGGPSLRVLLLGFALIIGGIAMLLLNRRLRSGR